MKYLVIGIALLCWYQNVQSQSGAGTIYKDVILISEKDVTANGTDFLIDIPITSKNASVTLFNNDFRIPSKLFFERKSFLPDQNDFFLITPDWSYYKAIRESEKRSGLHLKPIKQGKVYHIQRNNTGFKVDSLTIQLDRPGNPVISNYKDLKLQENEAMYYYLDCVGSDCCPRDTKWNLIAEIYDAVKIFEERYQVDVYRGMLSVASGKEGEHCDYYKLATLTNEQKIEFYHILEAAVPEYPRIYLPIIRTIQN